MEYLPMEMLIHISQFLGLDDLKSLSITCKRLHCSVVDKIWNSPRFDFIRLEQLSSLSHLPIKHLHSSDIINFMRNCSETVGILKKFSQLRVLELNHAAPMSYTNVSELRIFTSIDLQIIAHSSMRNPKKTLEFVRFLKCHKFGIKIQSRPRWSLEELECLRGVDIRYLNLDSIYIQNGDVKSVIDILVNVLCELQPKKICFNHSNSHRIQFTKKHIESLQKLYISAISTSYLKDSEREYTVHPWPILNNIKYLGSLFLQAGCYISLDLLQSFRFRYIIVDEVAVYGDIFDIIRYLKKNGILLHASLLQAHSCSLLNDPQLDVHFVTETICVMVRDYEKLCSKLLFEREIITLF